MAVISKESVNIVIVAHDAVSYTRKCIESIRRYTDYPHLITVVDNDSKDGTHDYLLSQPDIFVVENETNVGYGQAIIQGTWVL